MSVGKLQRYGLPFANVTNSGIATNQVTPGRTLETLKLRLTTPGAAGDAFTKAMIAQIKIKANGKTIVEASGTELDKLNSYRGEAADAAFLNIPFADFSLLDVLDQQVGAFDTSMGIANINAEVQIAGATNPRLTPILLESAQQKDRTGAAAPFAPLISKLLRYPYNIANGGKLPVTVPFGPQSGSIIKRLHVFHGGNMTGATVKQDGLVIHESVKVENEDFQKKAGRVPQVNVYTIDFALDGQIKNALDTRDARSLEWLFDFSAADTGSVIVEYLDPIGNL